jgi:hypothetical protein
MSADDLSRWWLAEGHRELEALLMAEWDPIGVAGVPEAYDEYRDYVEPLAGILTAGGGIVEVAEYLAGVQRGMMGFETSADQLGDVATRIVAWYAAEAPRAADRGQLS